MCVVQVMVGDQSGVAERLPDAQGQPGLKGRAGAERSPEQPERSPTGAPEADSPGVKKASGF